MIVARAPFRISYVGGGTDFKDYFKQDYGRVISSTINKYIYVNIVERFEKQIHLRYSETEIADEVDDLKHDIVREALKLFEIKSNVEIAISSEIPAKGSGLGSSSALALACICAFAAYVNNNVSKNDLYNLAKNIEIERLGKPIGWQDQAACCFGGLNDILFIGKDQTAITEINQFSPVLNNRTMLFYCGSGRKSESILQHHKSNIENKKDILNFQRELCNRLIILLRTRKINSEIGELINLSWQCKKQITPSASDKHLDLIVDDILGSGAYGVKVCGAGAGGFILVYCDVNKQGDVRKITRDKYYLQELEFNLENNGVEIVYNSNKASGEKNG